jgi:hypothetical protein
VYAVGGAPGLHEVGPSERDADKEPTEEVRDESYRVIPPHEGEDKLEGTDEVDVDGIKLGGGLKIVRSQYLKKITCLRATNRMRQFP